MSKKEMGDWIKLGESHINSSVRRMVSEEGDADHVLEWLHQLLYNNDVDVELTTEGLEISLQDDDNVYVLHASVKGAGAGPEPKEKKPSEIRALAQKKY